MCNLMVNRVKRRVSCFPKATYYKPREIPLCDLELINLSIEELETICLCDLLQTEQNEAADKMGVSRKTFWNDLQKARQKVADALVNGKAIEISGGESVISGECKVEFGGDGKGKRLIENDYCCPKMKGKATVTTKAGSVISDKNCHTIDE
jgi:uncharacterized protein